MSSRPHIVRSVSLDTDLALWIEEQAAGENRSVSNFVNTLLSRLRERAGPVEVPVRPRITPIAPTTAAALACHSARPVDPAAAAMANDQ